jgi:hypothetical protein
MRSPGQKEPLNQMQYPQHLVEEQDIVLLVMKGISEMRTCL